jgi:hypothetical protein
MVQQQLASTKPARIQVGKISPRSIVESRVSPLMSNKDALDVEPHAAGENQYHH